MITIAGGIIVAFLAILLWQVTIAALLAYCAFWVSVFAVGLIGVANGGLALAIVAGSVLFTFLGTLVALVPDLRSTS